MDTAEAVALIVEPKVLPAAKTDVDSPPLPQAEPRTVALVFVAVLLALFGIRLAAAFFVPLLLSLFLNYALSPTVTRLETWHVPRPLGATLVILVVVAVICAAGYRVGNDAIDILEQLPQSVQRIRLAISKSSADKSGPLENVKKTATELEKLATDATGTPPPAVSRTVAAAPAPAPALDFRSIVLVGTGSFAIFVGQLVSALFLTFFLLNAGDLFRRKLVHMVGAPLSRRKTALRILQQVDRMNQHYFAVVLFINMIVGVGTGIGMYAIGLERPLVWAIAAAILHTIPYIGSAVVAGAAALIAYGQFGTVTPTVLAAVIPITMSVVFGMFVQTWMMGRAARMNSPAVFVSLLFWGMLWGAWGLLLAVPAMVAIKTICDHVPRLKPFGEILGP